MEANFGAEPGKKARLRRPRGGRAGPGQALPAHRQRKVPQVRQILHGRARQHQAALFRRGSVRSRNAGGPASGRLRVLPGATSRFASRTRSSATRCGRCTSAPAGRRGRATPATRPCCGPAASSGIRPRSAKCTSPAAWARPDMARPSPATTTCPTESAYAETCAAIGLIFFATRMVQLEADSKYADVLERALYNGALSGGRLDGKKFFYVNPISSAGNHHRSEWFGCACCSPNIARLIAGMGQYAYSNSDSAIYVHQYIGSTAAARLAGADDADGRDGVSVGWDNRFRDHNRCGGTSEIRPHAPASPPGAASIRWPSTAKRSRRRWSRVTRG